jgi:hypothetical protein
MSVCAGLKRTTDSSLFGHAEKKDIPLPTGLAKGNYVALRNGQEEFSKS